MARVLEEQESIEVAEKVLIWVNEGDKKQAVMMVKVGVVGAIDGQVDQKFCVRLTVN